MQSGILAAANNRLVLKACDRRVFAAPVLAETQSTFAVLESVPLDRQTEIHPDYVQDLIASAKFYDEFSAQFTWKLPAGAHAFANSFCRDAKVKFKIP